MQSRKKRNLQNKVRQNAIRTDIRFPYAKDRSSSGRWTKPQARESSKSRGKTGGRANLHRTFIQYVRINIEAYESSTSMRKMKSEDDGVKNSILIPGGEKKRRHHRMSEMRKKNLDNICEEKIMAIRKGRLASLEASRARGFVHRPLELLSLGYGNPIS
nr:hypothetical protein [Tanacetum cinerariifolium]